MDEIKGIDLASELDAVRAGRLEDGKLAVRKAINGIYTDISVWQRELHTAQTTTKKLAERITAAQVKLEKLRSGDWSVLKQEQAPKEGVGPEVGRGKSADLLPA